MFTWLCSSGSCQHKIKTKNLKAKSNNRQLGESVFKSHFKTLFFYRTACQTHKSLFLGVNLPLICTPSHQFIRYTKLMLTHSATTVNTSSLHEGSPVIVETLSETCWFTLDDHFLRCELCCCWAVLEVLVISPNIVDISGVDKIL